MISDHYGLTIKVFRKVSNAAACDKMKMFREKLNEPRKNLKIIFHRECVKIKQRGPNRSPRAICGPRCNFLWPAEQFYTIQVLSIMSSGNLL